MENMRYFSLEQFNRDLWKHLEELNNAPFKKKPYCRRSYWEEERLALSPLPPVPYEYMERRTAKVSSDYHIRFDNTYIKNLIPAVAETLGTEGYNTKLNDERNRGAFIMDASTMELDRLLSRSQDLAKRSGKGGDK